MELKVPMTTEVVVIGVVLVVVLTAVLVIYVTTVCRQSRALATAAVTGAVSEPIELICGIRYRGINASWPGGQVRINDSGVEFSGIGTTAVASWPNVSAVRLVRPFTHIGWGVTYSLTNIERTITIWLSSHELAMRVLEACRYHAAPVTSGRSITV
jgi:hypothetical protein